MKNDRGIIELWDMQGMQVGARESNTYERGREGERVCVAL